MAAVPSTTTGRYFLDYTTGRIEHTLMVRYRGATPDFAQVGQELGALLGQLAAGLPATWRPVRARYADEGSDVTLPIAMPAVLANVVGTNGAALPAADEPREHIYVGRSPTTGRRVRLSIYGLLGPTPANYRLGPGETGATLAGVFNTLNGSPDVFLTVDGSKPTWYSYLNVNYNSYWERRARVS